MTFTREELLEHATRVGVRIRNPGDFPYYYAKRHVLPEAIRREGFLGIETIRRSTYAFTKAHDAIEIPENLPATEALLSLPSSVRKYITEDEQGMLVKIREADVLSDFLGEKAFHLQSHLRTESKELGQVEIDDVYVMEESGEICTVEAAAKKEKVIRSQIRRQVAGARTRFGVRTRDVTPVAVYILSHDKVVLLHLDESLQIEDGKVYHFKEPRRPSQRDLDGTS